MTNYENIKKNIKNMSINELAMLIFNTTENCCETCPSFGYNETLEIYCCQDVTANCYEQIKLWLESEVKECQ